MPVNLWKFLTIKIMVLGHSLHEAECIAAVIVIDCLVMYTIMGYRFSDADRDHWPENRIAGNAKLVIGIITGF
jgi:hypothetical protein